MASIFGHGLVAYTTAKLIDSKCGTILLFLAIGSAILPDIDVLAFNFGIPFEHVFGHRGFTHSILFTFLWSLIMSFLFSRHRKLIFGIVIFLSTLSHGILDAFTTGGKGVGFFIPFENSRYFFPNRFIKVSPIHVEDFFSEWGINVLISELKYIALPCIIVLIVLFVVRKKLNL